MLTLLFSASGCARSAPGAGTSEAESATPTDECAERCFVVDAEPGETVTAEARGVAVATATADENGRAELCPAPGDLTPDDAELVVRGGGDPEVLPLDIRAFGWELGREREGGTPIGIAAAPALEHPAEPFFTGEPGSWYGRHVSGPSPIGDDLYFAGSGEDDATDPATGKSSFWLGLRRSSGEVVGPLLPRGEWDAYSQNDPTVIEVGGRRVLFWDGHADPADPTWVGRAVSADGVSWTPSPEAPVYQGEGGAAHATAFAAADGFVELWTSFEGAINFAISVDEGVSFTGYCHNPVVDVEDSVGFKSAQVAWNGERYLMTAAIGPKPDYSLVWFESTDGVRWLRDEGSIFSPGESGWENTSVTDGQVTWEDGEMAFWYAGTGDGEPNDGIGVVR
jgi:hypothetical protein